jgi:hypothetical protein
MKGLLTLSILATLVTLFALGGYVMGNQETESGEDVKLIITTLGKTSIEKFDVGGFTSLEILGSVHEIVTTSNYVKCIDSICAGIDFHWLFYVNGKIAPKNAAVYKAKRGDILEFRLSRGG